MADLAGEEKDGFGVTGGARAITRTFDRLITVHPMSDEEIYQKLNAELEQVQSQVRSLRINQHIFWELQEIVKKNPNLQRPSSFYDWMGEMYAASLSVAIRRLVDKRKDTVSLVRLLMQLKIAPQCISREAYKRRFSTAFIHPDFLDSNYDSLIGRGELCPISAKIDDEISQLLKKAEPLKTFTDKHIAHTSLEPLKTLPKFQDLDDAIDMLETLTKRYLVLFRSVGMASLLPTWAYDWKDIFRYPWIAS